MPSRAEFRALYGLLAAAALALLLAQGYAGLQAGAARAGGAALAVVGNRFELRDAAGRLLPQAALVGAVVAVDDGRGGSTQLRIDAAYADAADPDIALYRLVQRDAQGEWRPLCAPGPDAAGAAFPVSGTWTGRGEHKPEPGRFGLACSHSAIGKCVRMGYKFWQSRSDHAPLWALHQACTRMLRADYCDDGVSHTRDGTVVNVEDGWGIQRADPEPSRFEASWDEAGAVCVERSQLGGPQDLDLIAARCPGRFQRGADGMCRSTEPASGRRALLSNRS